MPPSKHRDVVDVLRDVVGHLLGSVDTRRRALLLDTILNEVFQIERVTHFDSSCSAGGWLLPIGVALAMGHYYVDLRIVSVSTLVVVLDPAKLRGLPDLLAIPHCRLSFFVEGLKAV